jgi:hypothetical protein
MIPICRARANWKMRAFFSWCAKGEGDKRGADAFSFLLALASRHGICNAGGDGYFRGGLFLLLGMLRWTRSLVFGLAFFLRSRGFDALAKSAEKKKTSWRLQLAWANERYPYVPRKARAPPWVHRGDLPIASGLETKTRQGMGTFYPASRACGRAGFLRQKSDSC